MYGMQIQRIGLAVAGLALAVTVLVSPAAPTMAQEFSDSIDTIPVSLTVGEAETVQAGPKIPGHLPTADFMVGPVDFQWSGAWEERLTFTYRISNKGPDRARYNVTETEVFRPAGGAEYTETNSYAYILDSGAEKDAIMYCWPQPGTQDSCVGVGVKVQVNGIDPVQYNNEYAWD